MWRHLTAQVLSPNFSWPIPDLGIVATLEALIVVIDDNEAFAIH